MKFFGKKTMGKRGFTLMEVLVATGITAMLATIMMTILSSTMNVWSRSMGTLTADGQARTALEMLAQDLEGAMVRNDGVWLAATAAGNVSIPAALQGGQEIPAWSDYSFGIRFGVCLRFFTKASGGGDIAGPRAVSYEISQSTLGLYRTELSSEQTFTVGYDITKAQISSADGAFNHFAENLIANNVVDFGVRLWGSNTADVKGILFPRSKNAVDRDFYAPSGGTPKFADLYVRILTDEGLKLLKITGHGGLTEAQVIERYSKIYTRRVKVMADGF